MLSRSMILKKINILPSSYFEGFFLKICYYLNIINFRLKEVLNMKLLLSILIGVILFELYAKFYAKGDKKRILYGIVIGGIILVIYLFTNII